MLIQLERLDDAFNLKATNEQGNSVETDASPAIGGGGKGMRPMEMLLSSLGACSSIDVIDILRKMRQPLDDIKVTLNGEREKDKTPSLFTDIHVSFNLYGDLDVDKAKKSGRYVDGEILLGGEDFGKNGRRLLGRRIFWINNSFLLNCNSILLNSRLLAVSPFSCGKQS